MANLIRLISIERGYDPRDFVLTAYGGAGPMHAALIAKELGIPSVIVPPFPGIHSAFGMVSADIKHDFVRSIIRRTSDFDIRTLNDLFDDMETEARTLLASEGVNKAESEITRLLDMRYAGQAYIPVTVKLAGREGDDGRLRTEDIERA